MRKRLLAVILSVFMIGAVFPAAAHADPPDGSVVIDETTFPDENFRKFVKDHYGDGNILTEAQIAEVIEMDVSEKNISNLRGIENFTKLEYLNCDNNQLTSLDVSGCTGLVNLNCYSNQLTALDVSKCTGLVELYCSSNELKSLDVSGCTGLKFLYCYSNQLATLDVSKCTGLVNLYCNSNQLATLDVSKCTGLKLLSCSSNELESLDVSKCTGLEYLYCESDGLSSLDVSKCAGLNVLFVDGNKGLTDLKLNSVLTDTITVGTGTRTDDLGDYVLYSANGATLRADKEWGVHEWGTPEYDWSDDNKTVTAEVQCTGETLTCEEKHVITEGPVNTTAEVDTPAGCETKGKTKYTAVFENEVFAKQEKIVEDIPAKGHIPGKPVEENRVEPTYEKEGSYDEVVYCTVCGDEISRETKTIEKQKKPSSGGGGSGIVSFILTYETNGGEKIKSESHRAGDSVALDKTPVKEGYTFAGWYSDKELTNKITSVQMNSSKTVYAGWDDGRQPAGPDENAPLMVIRIGSAKYQLKGADMEMDSAPFIDENDRTMLPVRVVANALGISDEDIAWDDETKTASFTRPDGKVVSCTVGEKVIRIDDEVIQIDTAPVIAGDRIFLPMRALFNAFNVSDDHIIWDGANKTVTVTKEALEDMKSL